MQPNKAKKKINALTKDTFSQLTTNITDGNTDSWSLSATKMSALVSWIGGSIKIIRWKSMPYVLGIEICITKSRHVSDICDELCGKYPKGFKFTGWHPWCRCYAVPLLPKENELADFDTDNPKGAVTQTPKNFNDWVSENGGRIASAKSLPSFLAENGKYWSVEKSKPLTLNFEPSNRVYVDAKSDKASFRQQQKDVNQILKEAGNISLESEKLYTGRLYMGKDSRELLLGHSFDTEELNTVEQLPNILPYLAGGKRMELDTANHLYAEKVKNDWKYMVCYSLTINGIDYDLKCAAIKHEDFPIFEHPYSLKKKR